MEELTIIDGDILEDTFEDQGMIYDRFSHVIVCDMNEIPVRAVLYVYARNITRVREGLVVLPAETYPDYAQYAVKQELLCIISSNPIVLCSLVDKQDAVVPNLYQELQELEQLQMLDNASARSLQIRLKSFLRTVKIGNYDGDGIFWLPENYSGDGDDIYQHDDEDYEDYTRRAICTHIKSRRLPMAHIIPFSEERMNMMKTLIESLQMYDFNIMKDISKTHFVPLIRQHGSIDRNALETLMTEEFRYVKNEQQIDGNNIFIFTDEQLDRYEDTVNTKRSRELLRYYVGDYFDDLDLSHTFITGSAITASLIKTSNSDEFQPKERNRNNGDYRETMIEILYPRILTVLDEDTRKRMRIENISLWNIHAISETEGVMTKGSTTITFQIKSGSDVDMAVDNTVSDEEYRTIAQSHFDVIRRFYPYVKMREYTKPKGDWNYVIYTDDVRYVPVFRTVEIYRTSFRNICSHHVGAVRGCYTSRWSPQPKFYLTASGLWTSKFNSTPNYHYFAGRKSNPQDIIVKNKMRGINIADQELEIIISDYIRSKRIEISAFPFYKGLGIPYSIFAASHEYPYVREDIIYRRDLEERKLQQAFLRRELDMKRSRERQELKQRQSHERQAFIEANKTPIRTPNIPAGDYFPTLSRNSTPLSGLPTVVYPVPTVIDGFGSMTPKPKVADVSLTFPPFV